MTLPQDTDSLAAMKALRDRIRKRLMGNTDYKALVALENAIAQVEGNVVTIRSSDDLKITTYAPGVIVRSRPITQTDAAAQALETAGKPLSTAELMEKAKALGAEIGGKDPVVNFGSSMSRDPRFQNIKWRGQRTWWFADRSAPAEADSGVFEALP